MTAEPGRSTLALEWKTCAKGGHVHLEGLMASVPVPGTVELEAAGVLLGAILERRDTPPELIDALVTAAIGPIAALADFLDDLDAAAAEPPEADR